jgi:hypothetical protein
MPQELLRHSDSCSLCCGCLRNNILWLQFVFKVREQCAFEMMTSLVPIKMRSKLLNHINGFFGLCSIISSVFSNQHISKEMWIAMQVFQGMHHGDQCACIDDARRESSTALFFPNPIPGHVCKQALTPRQ